MGVVLHTHPVRGELQIHHNAERLQHLQYGWARLFEMTESGRCKQKANWENLDVKSLQSNLLKQYRGHHFLSYQAPFISMLGTIF